MAPTTPCGQNYVTPTMIKKGRMAIGDRIQFEEEIIPAAESSPSDIPVHMEMSPTWQMPSAMTPAEQQFQAEENRDNQGSRAPGSGVGGSTPAPSPGSGITTQNVTQSSTQSSGPQTWQPQSSQAQTWQPGGISPGWSQTNQGRPVDLSTIPLIFGQMTDYAHALSGNDGDTPVYAVPTHPLVPPEYDQTIDYDSAQYMNGFLRTQIGRSVMVQQLIGSGNTVDRYGFLVGVGNNYLLLQDISNGNIMLVDFYTVKYVYIYYAQPVFPSFRLPEERMMY